MLNLAILFLILAVIAGVFGFRGAAGAFAGGAKLLFAVFLILFLFALFF
jgi:uncharacterized membrane protein YtjA (UPF0391 family)